jgi:SAM-dependent methyltransferase
MTRLCSQVIGETRRTIEHELRIIRQGENRPLTLCDVGCWDGEPAAAYGGILGGAVAGIEVFASQAASARARGIDVAAIDLERETFPWPDASFDVVIANQVLEHLKNVWLPMSEMARVLKPGGHMIFSVPNLASLHNRVMLAFGWQPSSIRTFGPHVRSFTYRQAREFIEYGNALTVLRSRGVGFYPLPIALASPFASLWVGASHTPIFVAKRSSGDANAWRNWTDGSVMEVQTFYDGMTPPAKS